ncbi:hypothetical protein LUZ62_051988 [Rhynchospora pubera]|uniref:Uncharacterized protein n=1 Tax=Rhynchospora pubera TaxID=906938 RepID=A0AAV8GBU3_9POAL|nr:hypothetical protein LUZ62_051988 [Rhynchospora pubera]
MATLQAASPLLHSSSRNFNSIKRINPTRRRSSIKIQCVGWDPEGILGPPQGGHIARMEFKRKMDKDSAAREAFQREVKQEQERRRAKREARVAPDNIEGLVEYFLDTEAREIEIEIARLRPRLDKAFFDHIQREIAQIRFAVNKTQAMDDRLIELEAMQKVLLEGAGKFSLLYITKAYDKMQADMVSARENLMKILQSKDRKSTLLEMVEKNELNRSLLALLDENIASAVSSNQKDIAAFMEDVRSSVVKYITV